MYVQEGCQGSTCERWSSCQRAKLSSSGITRGSRSDLGSQHLPHLLTHTCSHTPAPVGSRPAIRARRSTRLDCTFLRCCSQFLSIHLHSCVPITFIHSFVFISSLHICLPSTPTLTPPPTQRVCVSAPEAAELPQHQEDGGDEEGPLFLRPSPRPRSLAVGVTPAHARGRVSTKAKPSSLASMRRL